MRLALLTLTCVAINSGATLVGTHATATSLDGIKALVQRRIPQHADSFEFALVNGTTATTGGGDSFVLSDSGTKSGSIDIQCTTVSACARGLYTYLTKIGGVDIWWTGSRLHLLPSSGPLPPIGNTPITGSAIVDLRYYFNTVTFGYTTAFYSFTSWSFLLDWLALRGVNLPLAWVGYEHTLAAVFREAGLTEPDISDFLSGPAFQPWNRFGNIQGSWGGNLPEQWLTDQFALQKQIVQRMVELGMTPVLPAFTGFVPRALHTVYPNASIVNGSRFGTFSSRFTNDSFLEPSDPLFTTLQKSFLSKQQAAYGANVSHIYTLDQYNENDPFSGDLDYLRNVSSNTFDSLRAADPEAIWLMQGWLFFSDSQFWNMDRIGAYLGGVTENDSMIILDLYSEAAPQWQRTSSYLGKPWVWCQLHGFGGNMGLEGNLINLTAAPLDALSSPGSSMKGMGLTMEGQEGNEIVYDILLDQAWSSSPIDIPAYVSAWVSRRYTVKPLPSAAQRAWALLSTTVYNNSNPNAQAAVKSILELSPSLTGLVNRTGHHPTLVFYDTNTTIVPALKYLIQASTENAALREDPEFAYDVVDIARQLLANRFIDAYNVLVATYSNSTSTAAATAAAGEPLLSLLSDLDALLFTNSNFLLSNWIRDARSRAPEGSSDKGYAAYLEYNARNQLTLWGPDGENNDYASKQWAGLVGGYYLPRWEAFMDYLAETKKEGTPYNATIVAQNMLDIGGTWDNQTWGDREGEIWGTRGDTWQVVDRLVKKWA